MFVVQVTTLSSLPMSFSENWVLNVVGRLEAFEGAHWCVQVRCIGLQRGGVLEKNPQFPRSCLMGRCVAVKMN